MYLTFPSQDSMEEDFLEQTKGRDIDLIVCSDAEAILGIGDQGVGGERIRIRVYAYTHFFLLRYRGMAHLLLSMHRGNLTV